MRKTYDTLRCTENAPPRESDNARVFGKDTTSTSTRFALVRSRKRRNSEQKIPRELPARKFFLRWIHRFEC